MEHTDVCSHLGLLLPTHITLCLFELNFVCLRVAQSPKVLKCIWSFLQISLAFISQNNLEPLEISGKRLSGDYVTIALVILDQVSEAGWPGRKAGEHSYQLGPLLISWGHRGPVVVFAPLSAICRCLCFHRGCGAPHPPPHCWELGGGVLHKGLLSE